MRILTKVGLVGLLAAIAVATGLVVHQVRYGFSARDEPTWIEATIARRLRAVSTPRHARETANPVAASPAVLAEARAHFADHCAICHANDGSGETTIGRNLYPKAPDMRADATQALTDGELFYIIRNGVRLTGMPAWGGGRVEDDLDSWKLVHFVRHLPNSSASDLAEMRALNPTAPRAHAGTADEPSAGHGTHHH